MALEYTLADKAGPSKTGSGQVIDKRLKRVLLVVAGILGSELIWLFGITPLLPLSVVDVSGIPGIDTAFILTMGGISPRSSFATVNVEDIRKRLETFYLVESAQVVKQYPDTVRILLEPRKIAAMGLTKIDGKIRPVYIDRFGVIIKIGNDGGVPLLAGSIPLVSGLGFSDPVLGARLPGMFEPLLTSLARINAASPELLTAISEIRINRKTFDGFDLILYPVHSAIRFRVDADLDEDTLRHMILMIDVLGSTGGAPVEDIDLRTGTASYRE
ncbi:MAG: FtsQ-type POTRA domain-containing protein [Spirochaetaceae bacterium]|nr:FtsQ-type POTRA domain-containing protein [Spirochaetaceae bacterium]